MLALSIASLLALAASPQGAFPKPGADPTGVVLDDSGKGIADAKVSLCVDLGASFPYSLAIEQVLRATPIHPVTTGTDGEFVVPLTEEQRRIEHGAWTLVVEKEGHQRWCEPVPLGPAGYLGTSAVLHRLDERDRVRFVIEDPAPGMVARVHRLEPVGRPDPDQGVVVDVPPDGNVSVLLALVPSPPPAGAMIELGYRASIYYPGRTRHRVPIDPDHVTRIEKGQPPTLRKITRQDRKPVTGLRALGTAAGLPPHWFALPGDELPEGTMFSVMMLAADGCSPQALRYVLVPDEPAPASRPSSSPSPGTLLVHVTDDDGAAVPGATVMLDDTCAPPQSWQRAPEASPLPGTCFEGPVPRTDARGDARIGAIRPGQHSLVVIAPGRVRTSARFTVRAELETKTDVKLEHARTALVRTVDENGKPVAFVWLALMPRVQRLERNGSVLIPSTDSRGLLRLTVPANADATLRLSERKARPISLAADEPTVVVVPATSQAVVLLPFDTRVAGARWLSGPDPADSYGSSQSGVEGTAAVLLCSPSTPPPRVVLQPCAAAPFELGGELQDPAHARNGICVVDRRRLERDLQVTFTGAEGKPLDDMTVVLASEAKTMMLTMCTTIAVRDPARPHTWRLRAFDLAPHELVACHPEHLDAPFVMPRLGAKQEDAPLVVPMQRGAGLTLVLTPASVLERAERSQLQLRLQGPDGRSHELWLDLWKEMQAGKGQPVTVRLPRGLTPGKYRVTFEATKLREPLDVTLASDAPLVLDLDRALRDVARK